MSSNPYRAPAASTADLDPQITDAERIRREHIGHERTFRVLAAYNYLTGFGLLLVAGDSILSGSAGGDAALWFFVTSIPLVLGVATLVVAWGYGRRAPWVRFPGTAVAALGLAFVPVGTLISIYSLWMIWSAKGRVVLGPGYAAVVAATPHVKYALTLGEKIAWGILILGVVATVVALVLATR